MQCSVDSTKLRQAVRYTIYRNDNSMFRADFVRYAPQNDIDREAVVFKNVETMQGTLHLPISFISDIKVYVLSKEVKQFPYLIPEVSMNINNYI